MSSILLGTTDAALKLGCSAENVRRLVKRGVLEAQETLSGRKIYRLEDVQKLASDREREKQAKATAMANQV